MSALDRLRVRVRLYAPVRTADEMGGAAVSYADQGALWAEIAPLSAAPESDFHARGQASRYRITIRAPSSAAPDWRVIWGARTFSVETAQVIEDALVALVCVEVAQ